MDQDVGHIKRNTWGHRRNVSSGGFILDDVFTDKATVKRKKTISRVLSRALGKGSSPHGTKNSIGRLGPSHGADGSSEVAEPTDDVPIHTDRIVAALATQPQIWQTSPVSAAPSGLSDINEAMINRNRGVSFSTRTRPNDGASPTVVLERDALQIVNMALQLSERRRQDRPVSRSFKHEEVRASPTLNGHSKSGHQATVSHNPQSGYLGLPSAKQTVNGNPELEDGIVEGPQISRPHTPAKQVPPLPHQNQSSPIHTKPSGPCSGFSSTSRASIGRPRTLVSPPSESSSDGSPERRNYPAHGEQLGHSSEDDTANFTDGRKKNRLDDLIRNEANRVGDFIFRKDSTTDSGVPTTPGSTNDPSLNGSEGETAPMPGRRRYLQNLGHHSARSSIDDSSRVYEDRRRAAIFSSKSPFNRRHGLRHGFGKADGLAEQPIGAQSPERPMRPRPSTSAGHSAAMSVDFKPSRLKNVQLTPLRDPPEFRGIGNDHTLDGDESLALSKRGTVVGNPGLLSEKNSFLSSSSPITPFQSAIVPPTPSDPRFRRSRSPDHLVDYTCLNTRQALASLRSSLLRSNLQADALLLSCQRLQSPQSLSEQLAQSQPAFLTRTTPDALIQQIDTLCLSLEASARHLNSSTATTLHSQISRLQDGLGLDLTPRARELADDADELLTDLASTKTMDLKLMGEELDAVARRIGRAGAQTRWVRRTAFVLLEWALVGMLWWIWSVVVVFRLVRSVARGTVGGVRWLLWL